MFVISQFPYSILNFYSVESEENFFLSDTLGSLHTLLLTGSAKRTTFEFFHYLEALEDS